MRGLAPVLAVSLLLLPSVLAAETYEHRYVVALNGNGGGGLLVRNGHSYAPDAGHATVSVDVEDVSGGPVFLRLCHEWTFNNGSHARNQCARACAASLVDSMRYPPYPPWWERDGVTYRVIVTLDHPSIPCAEATTGRMRVTFA